MSDAIKVWGAPEGWDAFLLAQRRREHSGSVLHVTRDDARMARLAEALAFVMPEAEMLRFPAWDCLPYDRVSPNPALVSERIATLARLLEKPTAPRIVLTTVNALVQRVPPRQTFAGASLDLRVNGEVKPEKLAEFLEANGYGRAGTVMEPGEYAMRGGIIDIFPSGESDPVRLDLFGDTIESIRVFDASTQRSAGKRASLVAAAGVRGAAGQGVDRAVPHRPGATCSARMRPRTRCICRSPTGGGIRAWSTGCRCSIRRWKTCWITCRTPRSAWITSPTRCWKLGWR